jgi:glucoamylase
MASKLVIFASLALLNTVVAYSAQCSVSDYEKTDCGFVGITQSSCEAKGCCWASSSSNGIPWCFYGAGASTSCYGYAAAPSADAPFSADETATMRKYFLANINIEGKGGIVAAPDYNTPGGSYYFHWMRDGALTMRCLQETNPSGNFSDVESIVKSYVSWVLAAQSASDPNGIDGRTEPKFTLPAPGNIYTGAWCRPQNDGPGLQATSLIMAADSLIAKGETAYVQQYLWTNNANSYHGGAIKFDLDYIVSNYATSTCDLWEEIRDADFFWNRITMKKAMLMGAEFAKRMGDTSSASVYTNTAAAINASLYKNHFNGAYVQESNSRPQDSAVIVGFNDGYDESDGLFAATSIEVAQTIASYNTLFCSEYAINTADTSKGLPGVLYGRYANDNYAGGNPWVLSTAALASLFYRAAQASLKTVPSPSALNAWKIALNSATDLPTESNALAQVFLAQGDGVLQRLRSHVIAREFHLDEQIDRNTGAQMSAKDLTWSYAEVLNALHYRELFLAMITKKI